MENSEQRKKNNRVGKPMSCYLFSFVVLLVSVFFPPHNVFAATLTVDPPQGNYGPGDAFVLTMRLDTENGECVNAARVELHYPVDWLKATAISKGESFFSLWIEEPRVDHEKGIITFVGGIPAGYCGRIQGDPGKTDTIAKIVFSLPGTMIGGKTASGPVPLNVYFGSSTQVLLNDGFGTPAPLVMHGGGYTRTLESQGMKNEWLEIVHNDTTPPEIFVATIEQDPKAFSGRYFLVFSTVDKQSGVDHYEVKEDDPDRLDFIRGKKEKAKFVAVTSPYVLADQKLESRIIVRAIDHAGNIEEIIVPPRNYNAHTTVGNTKTNLALIGAILLAFVIILIGWWLRKRRKKANDVISM